MKRILINTAIVLIALIIISVLIGLFLRGKEKTCKRDAGPEAIEACSFLILAYPSDSKRAEFLLRRAGQYFKIDSYKEGMKDFNTLLELNESEKVVLTTGEISGVYESLAILNLKLNNEGETLKYVNLSIQNGSKNPMLYMIKGEINIKRKKYSIALINFKIAENLKFNNPDLYFNFGVIYNAMGKYGNAYRSLKRVDVKKYSPHKVARYHKLLGVSAHKLSFYEEARRSFQKALDIEPDRDCSKAIRDIDKYLGTSQ